MKTARLGDLLSILANAGVLIGLVAVIYELNQNTAAVVGTTHQGLLELVHQSDSWLQDPSFAEVVYRAEDAGEKLEGAEARQYAEWLYGKFNVCEHVFESYQAGILTEEYWEGWDAGCKATLASRQGRLVWSERRSWYSTGFKAYFDGYLARHEQALDD